MYYDKNSVLLNNNKNYMIALYDRSNTVLKALHFISTSLLNLVTRVYTCVHVYVSGVVKCSPVGQDIVTH